MVHRPVNLREAPPLPADIQDWQRAIMRERTLNDLVEDVHRSLVNDATPSGIAPPSGIGNLSRGERYLMLLRATYDAHAVEGSLSADNTLAAMMIREKAKAMEVVDVASEKLAVINSALGVVLRRYKSSRKQRRNMVQGEEVPNDNGND